MIESWTILSWVPYEGYQSCYDGTEGECLNYLRKVAKRDRDDYVMYKDTNMDIIWRAVDAL